MVVEVTESGALPGVGSRLRRITVRLLLGAGLAVIAWLCTSTLHAGTAAAAVPTSANTSASSGQSSNGLLDVVAGSVSDVLGDTTTGVVDTATSVIGTTTNVTTAVVTTTTMTTTTTTTTTAVRTTVPSPKSESTTATRKSAASTVVQHAATTPKTFAPKTIHTRIRHDVVRTSTPAQIRHVATTAIPPAPRSVLPNNGDPAPEPAPQPPCPDVPAGSMSAGHDDAGQAARAALTADVANWTAPALVNQAGWTADPATLAARGQCLPATSPD